MAILETKHQGEDSKSRIWMNEMYSKPRQRNGLGLSERIYYLPQVS